MSSSKERDVLREHLLELLEGGAAHLTFEEAIECFPPEHWATRADSLPHSAWELLEHLRLCQWDILRFSIDPSHVSPDFPDGYWPSSSSPPNDLAWDHSVALFRRDHQAMRDLVADPTTKLLEPIPGGSGQTVAREVMLLADHTAYHLGQLVTLRRVLGIWPPLE